MGLYNISALLRNSVDDVTVLIISGSIVTITGNVPSHAQYVDVLNSSKYELILYKNPIGFNEINFD